jgi:tetratricopeptide (TPR) repeat protein
MSLRVPPNWSWFLPYLQQKFSGENLRSGDFFRYSTPELFLHYPKEKLLPLLLIERYLWENVDRSFFKSEMLSLVLEKEKVKGYLFRCPETFLENLDGFSFIRIEKNLFFYPIAWGGLTKLLFSLWKKEVPFIAVEVELETLEDCKQFLEIPQRLDFSRFSLSTKEHLQNYLPFENLRLANTIEERFLTEGDFIFLADKKESILELQFNDVEILERLENQERLLLVGKGILSSLLANTQGLFKNIGVLTKEVWDFYRVEGASPLMYTVSALEHARRLKEEAEVIFEGFSYHVLGDLYYEWEDLGKALKYYNLAENYTKQPIELALSKGAIYYLLGDFDKAEKILKSRLCGCEKEDPTIHYNLGLIYYQKGDYEKGRYHFYKAHLLEPKNHVFREALVKFLWDIGAYQELEEVLSNTNKLTLKEELYLGKLFFQQKKYEQAFDLLKKTLNLPERDGETLSFLAWLYVYFNKEKEVSELLKQEAKKLLTEKEKKRLAEEFGISFT